MGFARCDGRVLVNLGFVSLQVLATLAVRAFGVGAVFAILLKSHMRAP